MAVGCSVWTRHWTAREQRPSPMPREREAVLPSRGQPVVERSAPRECLHESVLSTWPTRLIGSRVLCGSSAWHREPKEIGRGAEVGFAVACLHLPFLSESPSCSDRCGSRRCGRSSASPYLDRPTSVGNRWRCFPWLGPSRRPSLLLVHPVPCVRIRASVGTTGSPAMPGSDHRTCVSLELSFPLFWL